MSTVLFGKFVASPNPPQPKTGEPAMTHNPKNDAVFWFVVIVGLMVLLISTAGCATTSQSVDVRCEMPAGGKPVAVVAYRLSN